MLSVTMAGRESRDASDPEVFDLLEFSYVKISFQSRVTGTATFKKGDGPLDEMLEDARGKLLNRDIKVRRESL